MLGFGCHAGEKGRGLETPPSHTSVLEPSALLVLCGNKRGLDLPADIYREPSGCDPLLRLTSTCSHKHG